MSPAPFGSSPATLWIWVVSRASAKVSGGRIPGKRLASIVLPEPGGPIISTLCAPAAATSSARFAVVCPRTSRKSRLLLSLATCAALAVPTTGWNCSGLWSNDTASVRCFTENTRTPSTMAASAALSGGTIRFRIPLRPAADAFHHGGLGGIIRRNNQIPDSLAPRRHRHREHSTNRSHAAIQRQFADEHRS